VVSPKTLIVIPAFNEEGNLESVINDAVVFSSRKKINSQVLVINDGSTDQTSVIAKRMDVALVNLPFNVGIAQVLQLAIRIGSEFEFEQVCIIDGDGQHPVAEIQKMLESSNGREFVVGVRNFQVYPVGNIRIKAINIIIRILHKKYGIKLSDPTSGFRLIPKSCFGIIQELDTNTNFLEDTVLIYPLLLNNQIKIKEVEVNMVLRSHGESSSQGFKNVMNYLSLILKLLSMRKIKK
jgi:glycosyltransferase involved in cell wall biosynthesis